MPKPIRMHSATLRKTVRPGAQGPAGRPGTGRGLLKNALCMGLACLLPLLSAVAASAAEAARPALGENYLFDTVADAGADAATGKPLGAGLGRSAQGAAEFLNPASRAWAGAQGLALRLGNASVFLAADVIAGAGDGRAAAASHADGRVSLFGAGNCTSVQMPGGHPAYALALAKNGSVLAGWAQGVNRLVFFDLTAPNCPASAVESALRGQISLTLSASGAFLAAQDESGQVWAGPRGGAMRIVASLGGAPAAIGFSGGEGVLLVLDANGRGGLWNPRTGKALRGLEVPGGPFARGDFHGLEARLWTVDGRLVRWDVLHNRAADAAKTPPEAPEAPDDGWLELRGSDLHATRPGRSWSPQPLYDFRPPQLGHSRHAGCLRLLDVDGVVRYFDAKSGLPRSQCFADDWTEVAVQADGTAQIPGLRLRVFDTRTDGGGGGKVNMRAVSETEVVLWTDAAPDLTLRVQAPQTPPDAAPQTVAEGAPPTTMPPVSVPLRQGLAAGAPVRALPLE